jgi:hypothetical protein
MENLQEIVPSAFATKPDSSRSSRYQFVSTADYLKVLGEKGFEVDRAVQTKTRKGNPESAKHLITLVHKDITATRQDLGMIRPRISILNSHNGSSRFECILGLMRLACENGLMVSIGSFDDISFLHNTSAKQVGEVLTDAFFAQANLLVDAVDKWASIQLDSDQQMQLAITARNLRFGDDSTVDAEQLLAFTRRQEDVGGSLWNVFNRLQENCLQGGIRWNGMKRKSREVRNIANEISINRSLWGAAAKFAE